MPGLADKYRPTTWGDVVGQEASPDANTSRRGDCGPRVWISGQSGTGKTTIARRSREVRTRSWLRSGRGCARSRAQSLEAQMACGWGGRRVSGERSPQHGSPSSGNCSFLGAHPRPRHRLHHNLRGKRRCSRITTTLLPLSRCLCLALRGATSPALRGARQTHREAEGLDGQPSTGT